MKFLGIILISCLFTMTSKAIDLQCESKLEDLSEGPQFFLNGNNIFTVSSLGEKHTIIGEEVFCGIENDLPESTIIHQSESNPDSDDLYSIEGKSMLRREKYKDIILSNWFFSYGNKEVEKKHGIFSCYLGSKSEITYFLFNCIEKFVE